MQVEQVDVVPFSLKLSSNDTLKVDQKSQHTNEKYIMSLEIYNNIHNLNKACVERGWIGLAFAQCIRTSETG